MNGLDDGCKEMTTTSASYQAVVAAAAAAAAAMRPKPASLNLNEAMKEDLEAAVALAQQFTVASSSLSSRNASTNKGVFAVVW